MVQAGRRFGRFGRGRGDRQAHGEQGGGREVLTCFAPAVVLVPGPQPVQAQAAEAVLVQAAGAPHLPGIGGAAPPGRRVPVGIGGAHPHPAEASPGGPDVVVHLPAGPGAVLLVSPADCLDDLAPDGQAEVSQAMQWFERANRPAEALAGQRGGPGDVRRARAAEGGLLVPRSVGGGTGQPRPRLGERRHQQRQAPRPEHGAALNENHHRGVACPKPAG